MFAALWLLGDNVSEHAGAVGLYLFSLNLAVGVFDLLPALPLDGGRILRSVVWGWTRDYDRATGVALHTGQALSAVLVVGGVVVGVLVYWFSGFFVAFLGLFLFAATLASQREAAVRRGVRDLDARDLMVTPAAIDPEATLEEAASASSLGGGDQCLLVGVPRAAQGVVCPDQIEDVPRRKRGATPVADVMTPMEKVEAVALDESGPRVLDRMEEARARILVVVSGEEVVGVIRRKDVYSGTATRSQQQKEET
jgi:hypothetical protein